MKKMITILALALGTSLFAGGSVIAPVEVETYEVPWTGAYIGLGLTANQTYVDGGSNWFTETYDSTTNTGLQINGGYTAYNNGQFMVSVEARAGVSETSEIVETSYLAVYAKPAVQFGNFNAYALAGYGTVDFTSNYNYYDGWADYLISQTTSVSDFTFGIGGEYSFTPSISVFVDYVALPSFEVVDVDYYTQELRSDVMSLGINYRW